MGKKLYRVEEGAMLAGVCGGVGEYFGIDPNVVRLITVILTCCATAGLWAYLVAALILPKKSQVM